MIKIIKYLKPFALSIIMIIGLLFVQATCDLSLPDYMSNIVNVGIQQGGIKNAVPDIIRESELNKFKFFMNKDEIKTIEDNYLLLSKNDLSKNEYEKYLKEYSLLSKEGIYKLNTTDKNVIDKLDNTFGKTILIVSGIEKNMKSKDIDYSKMISNMPKQQLNIMKEKSAEKFKDMPDSMIKQSAIPYIHKEYKIIGVNTNNLQTNYILFEGFKMLLLALLSMIATVIVGMIAARVAAGLGKNLRAKIFDKVINFSNVEFDKFSTASLITRSTNDIQQIQMLMVMMLRIVFYAPILGVGGIIKVLNTDNSMGWIIVVAVVSILVLVTTLFSIAIPKFKMVQKLVDKMNLVTRESLIGMLAIRAFNTQKYEEKRFEKTNRDLTNTNLFINRLMTIMMPMMMLIMNLITVLIVWVGAHQVDVGNMQVGDMMAFIQYTMQIIMAFLMISMVSIMLPRASVSAGRIVEVLDTNISINDIESPKKFNSNKKGYVEFKNVSFRYPDAEENVLSNVTFTAKPGETTAFIGSTGSGKSTLINLIPRFFDVTEGEILVDGVNIKEVNQKALRDKIGYISQKGILFSGTIESNIKYGKKDSSNEEMIKAATTAQAIEFINSKDDTFETEISQGGNNVSGGQKQRLSIARALIKNPEIFIFDDSFSALDFKTDTLLRKALKEETSESTVLIVAQRISTIMNADNIIVLDEGNIVGIGNHKELMENCEVYKQIALSQLSKEELHNER